MKTEEKKEKIGKPVESEEPEKHQLEDEYNYNIGEGDFNPDDFQRDPVDTSDRGLGNGVQIDNTNINLDPKKVGEQKIDKYKEYQE